jgi:molecular chaperone GrpE
LIPGRDDPAEDPAPDDPRADERVTELEDPSLAEPPPVAGPPRDGFDEVDGQPEAEGHAPRQDEGDDVDPARADDEEDDALAAATGEEKAEPAGASAPVASPPLPAPEEVESSLNYRAFEQRARLAEDRLAEVLDGYRKLKSETEEHKVRIGKNMERRYVQRHERLLLKFIDILDNLDRALDATEHALAGESLIQGLILVRTQLLQTLKEEGLERIPVLGLPFDPHVSEGIGQEPVPDAEKHGLVVRELLRGYKVNGRVVRASRVVIGEYKPPPDVPGGDSEPAADEPSEN